jgi:hypothetical protein
MGVGMAAVPAKSLKRSSAGLSSSESRPFACSPGPLGGRELPLLFRERIAAAFPLLLLAPFVGEYLLGNIAVQELFALPILALMYGGGALLVREIAVRLSLDWIGVLLLGAAYGLAQAGLVDQSLFDPDFQGMEFQAVTPIPALGFSAYHALSFVTGHAIWSISIPIALTGLLFPRTRRRSLIGPVGLVGVVAAYLVGCWLIFDHIRDTEGFIASIAQHLGSLTIVLLLIGAALWRSRPNIGPVWRTPAPIWFGLVCFLVFSLYILLPETWIGVALKLGCIAAALWTGSLLGRHPGWTAFHDLAVVAGGLLTYAWLGFVLSAILDPGDQVRFVGNAAFAIMAVLLILVALWQARRKDPRAQF